MLLHSDEPSHDGPGGPIRHRRRRPRNVDHYGSPYGPGRDRDLAGTDEKEPDLDYSDDSVPSLVSVPTSSDDDDSDDELGG
jgi:hypothetical protein